MRAREDEDGTQLVRNGQVRSGVRFEERSVWRHFGKGDAVVIVFPSHGR